MTAPVFRPSSDLEIARAARLLPIERIAARLAIPPGAVYRYGPDKAKLDLSLLESHPPAGRLILVTAISPTPAGEGKTTTTIGLGDALSKLGERAVICLREPSLGPCFGAKGGAAGGGYAQIVPMEDINLHFTGDLHAITAAHNLLAAVIDNHLYWGNRLDIDPRRIVWRRAMDLNDRALRQIVVGLGGNGPLREDAFDITVASEVMAILCLAGSLADLRARLARIVIGYTRQGQAVCAEDLKAAGAMTALLKDALRPNLVQTLENTPALVHGGPFANIAHGCNSVIATRMALGFADYVITEAGFGADLGAEKFLNIKCRKACLTPSAIVLVATLRALKMQGGVAKSDLERENLTALKAGAANLVCHIENLRKFALPVTVALNSFTADTEAEIALIRQICADHGVTAHRCTHWAEGGGGALELARAVMTLAEQGGSFQVLYPDTLPLVDKIRTVAREIYRAKDIALSPQAAQSLAAITAAGYAHLPVCMAKTQYSFSADPAALGAPSGHVTPVRAVRLAAGAEFIIVLCGDIMTMPGLPRIPVANTIDIDATGAIQGVS